MIKDYKKLQNGSDIRVVALEGIEGQSVNLTEQVCRDIGRGFAVWLMKKSDKRELRVAVGRDSRLSGEILCNWICDAMVEQGLLVTNFGMASTPAMFMSTVTDGYSFDGSVMITASHLPINRNGFKFFTPNGGLEAADIKEILAYAAGDEVTGMGSGALSVGSFMDTYAPGSLQIKSAVQLVRKSSWKAFTSWWMQVTAQAPSMLTKF